MIDNTNNNSQEDEIFIDVDYTIDEKTKNETASTIETEETNDLNKIINGEPFFYTTVQVAEMLGVEPSTIRYWSKRFEKILNVEVSNKNKQYKKIDIAKLKFIKKLKADGMTLQQIEDYCSEKGFNLNNIENAIIDGSNPLAIQTFTRAITEELDKKLETFAKQILQSMNISHKNYLDNQKQMNDNLQANIVTTVDEVISEKLDQQQKEIQIKIDEREKSAKERDVEMINNMRRSMDERYLKWLEEQVQTNQKSGGIFKKLFGKK